MATSQPAVGDRLGRDRSARGRGGRSTAGRPARRWGWSTRSGAVTPASLWTLTRKARQPCCIRVGSAGPCAALTRLSGLIVDADQAERVEHLLDRRRRPRPRRPSARASSSRRPVRRRGAAGRRPRAPRRPGGPGRRAAGGRRRRRLGRSSPRAGPVRQRGRGGSAGPVRGGSRSSGEPPLRSVDSDVASRPRLAVPGGRRKRPGPAQIRGCRVGGLGYGAAAIPGAARPPLAIVAAAGPPPRTTAGPDGGTRHARSETPAATAVDRPAADPARRLGARAAVPADRLGPPADRAPGRAGQRLPDAARGRSGSARSAGSTCSAWPSASPAGDPEAAALVRGRVGPASTSARRPAARPRRAASGHRPRPAAPARPRRRRPLRRRSTCSATPRPAGRPIGGRPGDGEAGPIAFRLDGGRSPTSTPRTRRP